MIGPVSFSFTVFTEMSLGVQILSVVTMNLMHLMIFISQKCVYRRQDFS